ncbi:GNAT family N-acetyltransferase [Ciceribacter selenitireducens]|uniref:GNAT family N-acetyltransferase n=1 Tax=Ciceribacter selenitireducens TaxID=448181 RepID=UPI0015F2702C|nr:GNAT family N-acetyltransferase [Ciceribacter selenitireducens]
MIFTEDKTSLIPLPVNTQTVWNRSLSNREQEALQFISGLSEDYPDIQNWYVNKVVPGLRTGTRFLLPVHRDGKLVAVGIAKNDGFERKICTVRVAPHHAGRGLGLRVFDGLLKWLDDDQPGLTVSATKLPAFERIFDWYKFRLTGVENGLYVPGRQEVGYNHAIFAKKDGQSKILEPVHDKHLIASAKSGT